MAKKKKRKLTHRNADKHDLYQKSVQAPDVDAQFLARLYKKANDNPARLFREDFCGTAILSCEFVKRHSKNHAIGVDLDRPTLDWGRKHNLSDLSKDQHKRIRLIQDNVLKVHSPKADIIAAMNFSYSVFKTREAFGAYISNAHRSLNENGLFVMDAWGGAQSQELMEERKRMSGFTYVWDQFDFDPVSHHILCKIHFEFRDGSRIKNAFIYDWRLWTLPEMQELMTDAGFQDVHILWEGTEKKTGGGNGVFRPVTRGGDELAWIAYVVGKK